MAEQESKMSPAPDRSLEPAPDNWRSRVLAMGGLIGAILGLISAYLYLRSVQEKYGDEPHPDLPQTSDALRLGMSLLGIVRTIAEWGRR